MILLVEYESIEWGRKDCIKKKKYKITSDPIFSRLISEIKYLNTCANVQNITVNGIKLKKIEPAFNMTIGHRIQYLNKVISNI